MGRDLSRRQWAPRAYDLMPLASACLACFLGVGLGAAPAYATPINLVQNGSFETGNLTGWTLSGSNLYAVTNKTGTVYGNAYGPESGAYYLQYDAYVGSPAIVSQALATTPGQTYDFSFWVETTDSGPNSLVVKWGNQTALNMSNAANLPWTQYSYEMTATSSSTTISFAGADNPMWVLVDNVSVTEAAPVAEPPSLPTFVVCLLGLAAVIQRRRRAA